MQQLVKVGSGPHQQEYPGRAIIVASLLYYTGRIAKWCTVLGASNIMCMPRTTVKGQILANLVANSARPPLKEEAATWSNSRGSGTRLVLEGIY